MRDTIDIAREIAAQYSKAERERFQTWTHDYMMERLMELVYVSAAAEREACAKVCEEKALLWPPSHDFKLCAAAIRARGQA